MSRLDRKWVIITLADYTDEQLEDLITKSIQSNVATLRKSLDNTKAILKWDRDTPEVFDGITTYSHSEILEILNSNDWIDNE